MIRGGTSAAGKTGAIRTGYTQFFIPFKIFAFSAAIQANIESRNKAKSVNAFLKIENELGGETELVSCSYFQVQKYLGGGVDSAYITIEKPDVWSIWGDEYPELLRPSKRTVSIYAGIPGEEIVIFKGRITGAAETKGSAGGSINLTCNDHRYTLKRETPTQLVRDHSRYCEIHKQAFEIFKAANQHLIIADNDASGEFSPVLDSFSAVLQALSGAAEWISGNAITVSSGTTLKLVGTDVLTIDDEIINTAARDFYDSNAFNTVLIKGLVSGTLETDVVADSADVAKRGNINYPTVIGNEKDDLEKIRAQAESMISAVLQGRFFATIIFNPYLLPGQIIKIQSSRFNLAVTTARINSVRHQYKRGSCATYIDGLEVNHG